MKAQVKSDMGSITVASPGSETEISTRKKRRLLLGIILVGTFMANLDAVMMNIALPTITSSFHTSLSVSQWVITGYVLSMTGLLIISAKISEFTGISRLYKGGLLLFTISSLACGLSTLPETLILFRIIQGIGASLIYCGMGPLILHASLPDERGSAMGYVTAAVAGATLLGPVIGGIITDLLGWQYLFFINVPIGILVLAAACTSLQIEEVCQRWNYRQMDWIGACTLLGSIVLVLLFCTELASGPLMTLPVLLSGAGSLLFISLFIYGELRQIHPLVDLNLFKNCQFAESTIGSFLFFASLNLTNIVGPFYLEGVMNLSPTQVGQFFLIVPLLMFILSPVVGSLSDRHPKDYATFGLILLTLACILQAVASSLTSLLGICLAFVLRGVGSGFFQGPNNTHILTSLPPEKTAISSSIASTARAFGIGLGVSIASISMSLELSASGYYGQVLEAGPRMLTGASVVTLLVGAGICILAVLISVFWRKCLFHRDNLDIPG